MSIVAMKRKSVILYGSNVSGKPTNRNGDLWINRGPFGYNGSNREVVSAGTNGFSINGSNRNVGRVGQTYAMSKNGTPFRGLHPYGWGGSGGRYYQAEPVFNAAEVETLGNQWQFNKPSVLSTAGMLRTRFKWAYNGKYPAYVVKNMYTGNLVQNASEGVYIGKLASASTCNLDVNNQAKYSADCINNSSGCTNRLSVVNRTYNDVASQSSYGKPPRVAVDQSTYMLYLTKKCSNKEEPIVVNNGGNPCFYGCGGGGGTSTEPV
jgi:hypothetical protein